MEIMGYLEDCMDPGQTATKTQSRLPVQLDAPGVAAGRARRHRSSNSNSPFRPRPNYAVLSSVLAVLLFAASGAAQAATINAASPSLVDVTTAIASAVDGDTVIVPAGTASWTAGLVITKGITLMGQTTTNPVAKTADDQTVILDDVVRGPGGTPIIWVQAAAGKSYRVSGITFRSDSVTIVNYNGGVRLSGNLSGNSNSQAVRIDHCHFDDLKYQNDNIAVTAAIYGVIDHNVFNYPSSDNSTEAVNVRMSNWGGPNQYGDGSWTEPAYFGSEKFVFIEDNCINNTSGNEFAGDIDDANGGRWVCRYNHFYNTGTQSHGTESGRYRGGRCREVYNNDFHWTIQRNIGGIRSGGFITHDNTHDGVQPYHGAGVTSYRVFQAIPPWGGSTGNNPWDVNVTEADGTHVDGHSPYLFDSGTATGGSTTTIIDTTKTWTTNQWVGYTAKRVSDNGMMVILSNTSTVLTGAYSNSHGQGTTWTAGDQYQIHKVLVSQDQACRGAGDLITGDTPVNSTTGTAVWTHQALEPAYMWNDIYTPTNAPVTIWVAPDYGLSYVLTEGRDFFNNTPMPGYTPYTYPHPLVSGGGHGPQTPGDLHIMQ
jgi:hypothetical protein